MNCLEFRRLVEIDPDSRDEDFMRHKAECRSCAELAARALRFSVTLDAAARIDVPENLASRILLKQSFAKTRTLFARRHVLALAASIVAAAGLALSGTYVLTREDPLGREVFTLIRNADDTFASKTPLDSRSMAKALAQAGIDVTGELEKVTYAGQSLVRGKLSGHVVIQGEWAPCTVLLIPEINVASRFTIRSDNLRGLVVPFDGGAIVIVGSPQEVLEPVIEQVKAAIRWRHA